MQLSDQDKTELQKLRKRIIDISYKNKSSHIGSCLTALPIMYEIYKKKGDSPFVLSSGHAGLALYVILEHFEGKDAEELFATHGVHPNRDIDNGIYASTGSLGHGLGIAVGMALADRTQTVYVLMSDGETAEGTIWEAINTIIEYNIKNIQIYINCNWYGAYRIISPYDLRMKLESLLPIQIKFRETSVEQYPFLKGQDAHYYVMTDEDYKSL